MKQLYLFFVCIIFFRPIAIFSLESLEPEIPGIEITLAHESAKSVSAKSYPPAKHFLTPEFRKPRFSNQEITHIKQQQAGSYYLTKTEKEAQDNEHLAEIGRRMYAQEEKAAAAARKKASQAADLYSKPLAAEPEPLMQAPYLNAEKLYVPEPESKSEDAPQ